MLCIRILVVSNMPGEVDRATSSLEIEGATVVAKETYGDAKNLAKYAYDAFSSGDYDFMAVISDNPTAADITLRKYDGITPAVCRDLDDARNAREAGEINVVVLKGAEDGIDGAIQMFAKGGSIASHIKARIPTVPRPAPRRAPEELHSSRHNEDPKTYVSMPRRPGVGGWIKDALGIVDTEPRKEKHNGDSNGS